jgi:hypothetical protein
MHLEDMIMSLGDNVKEGVRTHCDDGEYFSCYGIGVPAIQLASRGWTCIFAIISNSMVDVLSVVFVVVE